MESLFVTYVLPTSKKAKSDQSFSVKVNAENDADALVLAKKFLKTQYQNLNLAKAWCWFVEGKPNRS